MTDWCDDPPGLLSFDMACETCSLDIDNVRGKVFNQHVAAFGEQIFFKPRKTARPLQKLAVNWLDGCWLGVNTRTGEQLARRLEDNLARRAAFAKPEAETVQSEVGANPPKGALHDEAAPQESEITGGASSSVAERDVDKQTIHAGKQPVDPGGDDDMVWIGRVRRAGRT